MSTLSTNYQARTQHQTHTDTVRARLHAIGIAQENLDRQLLYEWQVVETNLGRLGTEAAVDFCLARAAEVEEALVFLDVARKNVLESLVTILLPT